ncbi:hypothetical protein LDENG_00168920, partial [Lucifuga dentata]
MTKLKQVINRVRQLKSKIIFLQETHLRASEMKMLSNRWPGQVFFASYNNYSRGVLFLIHKSVPFQVINTIQDQSGRHVIVQGNILSCKLNLVSIYGPNEDTPMFYQNIFLALSTLQGHCVLGGDFNCTLAPEIDRSTSLDLSHVQTRKILLQSMDDLNLVDVFRKLYPNKIEYSCYSQTYRTHSRIDYFLVAA